MGRVVVKRDKLLERLRQLGATNATVAIGVLGAKGAEQHKDSPPGTTVAEVAQWNHFGTGTIPARPFLTIALARHGDALRKLQARIARGLLQGKIEIDQALGLLGEAAVGYAKQTIADGVEPANAASTIAAKGSSTPLIDKGQLRGSITHEVRSVDD